MVDTKNMASPVEDKKSCALGQIQKGSGNEFSTREKRLTRKNRQDVQDIIKASKVYEAPKLNLAARPLTAASTAVAEDNAAVVTVAKSVQVSPAGDAGVVTLESTKQAAKLDLALRPLHAASTASADGNVAVVTAAESAQVSPAGEPGVGIVETAEQAAKPDLILRSLSPASTASVDSNGTVVTGVESVQASHTCYLEDFDGPIAADYYAPIPFNGYLWYPNYNPMAEPYDPRRPSFDDMRPQQEAYDDMLGNKPRRTLAPPKALVVRLVCKDCGKDPPNLVEYDDGGNVVCEDCGLVQMQGVYR